MDMTFLFFSSLLYTKFTSISSPFSSFFVIFRKKQEKNLRAVTHFIFFRLFIKRKYAENLLFPGFFRKIGSKFFGKFFLKLLQPKFKILF